MVPLLESMKVDIVTKLDDVDSVFYKMQFERKYFVKHTVLGMSNFTTQEFRTTEFCKQNAPIRHFPCIIRIHPPAKPMHLFVLSFWDGMGWMGHRVEFCKQNSPIRNFVECILYHTNADFIYSFLSFLASN